MLRGSKEYGPLRYLYAGWAVLETMLFGGIVNGWASLVFVLKDDGLYADLCGLRNNASAYSNTTLTQTEEWTKCTEQDAKLNLWFTITAALRNIFGIVIGLHIFKFGTRSARLTGWILFGTGSLMMAFTNASIPWLVLPSLLLLSYGGVTLLLTNVQVSILFPRAAGVIVTLVSGGFDFSAATQLVVKLLHDSGSLSRQYSFISLAVAHAVMVLISTLIFMPKDMFVRPSDVSLSQQSQEVSSVPRMRRDSLYDWSEINVRTSHSSFHCGSYSDSSSDEEQREQQTMTSFTYSVNRVPSSNPPREDFTENRCRGEVLLRVQARDGDDDFNRNAEVVSKSCEFTGVSLARRMENGNSQNPNPVGHLSTSACEVPPHILNQDGLRGSNNSMAVTTVFGTMGEVDNKSIAENGVRGKFISVIHVSPPTKKESGGTETDAPWQSERGRVDGVRTKETDKTKTDKVRVGSNGHVRHKVSIGVSLEDTDHTRMTETNYQQEDGQSWKDEEEEPFPTLKSCLTSTLFWLHVLWQSFNVLRLVAFFGLINPKLTAKFKGDKDKVSFYTNVQAYFMLGIMGVCWISGALYDWQASIFKERKTVFERRVLPGALPLAVTSLIGVAISAMWLIESEVALFVMFALLVFYNAFIFGVCLSFFFRVFPERYFGILNGVLSIVVGTFCFLQFAIFIWHDTYAEGPIHDGVLVHWRSVCATPHQSGPSQEGDCQIDASKPTHDPHAPANMYDIHLHRYVTYSSSNSEMDFYVFAEIFMLSLVVLSLVHPIYIVCKGQC